jgi:cyclopropane fatty-acyl-phospholipid synthase-like methyltransferase
MSGTRKSQAELRDLYRADYVRRYHQEDRERLARLVVLMDLEPHMITADLGCGNGLLLGLIHDRVAYYHGIDFSSEFIDEARQRQQHAGIRNAEFHCRSIVEFCREHCSEIDRAFALDFAEHVYDEELLGIARAVRSSLREGGRFYLHTPNLDFFLERLKDRGILRQFPEHVAVRRAERYVELLAESGFSQVRILFLPHYLRSLAWLHAFSRLPLVGRHLRARLFLECLA